MFVKKFLKIDEEFVEEFLSNGVPVFCTVLNPEKPDIMGFSGEYKFAEYNKNLNNVIEYFVEVSAYLECEHYLENIEKYGFQGMVNETKHCFDCGNCYE